MISSIIYMLNTLILIILLYFIQFISKGEIYFPLLDWQQETLE